MTINKQKKNIILRRVWLAAAVLVFSVLQNTDGWFPQLGGARALLLIPLVTAISMFERDTGGILYGLFAGALWDSCAGGNNFNMIFFVIVGFACGTLIKTIMRNNFMTHLLLTGVTTLLYCLGYWLWHYIFGGLDESVLALVEYFLPTAIYTVALSPLIFFAVMAIERHYRDLN